MDVISLLNLKNLFVLSHYFGHFAFLNRRGNITVFESFCQRILFRNISEDYRVSFFPSFLFSETVFIFLHFLVIAPSKPSRILKGGKSSCGSGTPLGMTVPAQRRHVRIKSIFISKQTSSNRFLWTAYFRGAHGIMLFYDIAYQRSFDGENSCLLQLLCCVVVVVDD